ncbi:UNVERIFIED_CONTAM: hypothetical protein RMT77_012207 [Armadillidium vulgare]
MLRLKRFTPIENIIKWNITVPNTTISITYKRKHDSYDYFSVYAYTLQCSELYISVENLLKIHQNIKNWSNNAFPSCSPVNKWSEVLTETPYKKLNITFCKLGHTNTVDVRIWRRIKDNFTPTSHGFTLTDTEQILSFVNIQSQVEMKLKEKAVLEDHITATHNVLVQYYYKSNGLWHIKLPPVEEFTYKFRE